MDHPLYSPIKGKRFATDPDVKQAVISWLRKIHSAIFYISLAVCLGIILVNNQPDTLFSMYLFISLLYTFRATRSSTSGESNCISTSSGVCHSVYKYVTAWYAG